MNTANRLFRTCFSAALAFLGAACASTSDRAASDPGAADRGTAAEDKATEDAAAEDKAPEDEAPEESAEMAHDDEHHASSHKHQGGHHRFQDAEAWSERFDAPEREEWQKPEAVIDHLGLKPADRVADIGAGTGYFAVRIAPRVPEGKVYAVDIEPDMVEFMKERAKSAGLDNLVSVLGDADDPKLPEAVDLVLLVDTYHHVADRVAYFKDLAASLKPGGRVAIVDFKAGELPVGPPPAMKITAEEVSREMNEAGYVLADDEHELLPYQYLLLYERAK